MIITFGLVSCSLTNDYNFWLSSNPTIGIRGKVTSSIPSRAIVHRKIVACYTIVLWCKPGGPTHNRRVRFLLRQAEREIVAGCINFPT